MTSPAIEDIENITNSGWSTQQLAGFALHWPRRGNDRTAYVWHLISTDHDDAKDYYASLLVEDPEHLRWEAAEALAEGGWTASAINRAKS